MNKTNKGFIPLLNFGRVVFARLSSFFTLSKVRRGRIDSLSFSAPRSALPKSSTGFTLIELLVVIAIIGILSSVVLSSLNTARDKGADAAIKADIKGIVNQAAIYYDTNGNYGLDFAAINGIDAAACPVAPTGSGTIFEDDQVAAQQIADAMIKGGSQAMCASGNGVGAPDGSAATSWAVSVPLKSDPLQSWCVDGNGSAKIITDPAVITIDAAFNAVCP